MKAVEIKNELQTEKVASTEQMLNKMNEFLRTMAENESLAKPQLSSFNLSITNHMPSNPPAIDLTKDLSISKKPQTVNHFRNLSTRINLRNKSNYKSKGNGEFVKSKLFDITHSVSNWDKNLTYRN